jgi:hypothetical protein
MPLFFSSFWSLVYLMLLLNLLVPLLLFFLVMKVGGLRVILKFKD